MTAGLALLALLAVPVKAARVSMGCTWALALHGPDAAALRTAAEAALDEVDRLDRLMSHYKPESPLSRINREAARRPVDVDEELLALLRRCQELSRASEGAFDVTVGPLMKAWGFVDGAGRLPGAGTLARARAAVGYDKLRIDTGTVRFARPGMALDLGGIGKGYAVDRALAVLRRHGVGRALVSAGGSTVAALGSPPDTEAWTVEVRLGGARRSFRLRDQALSVAGVSEQSFVARGVRYGHVLDPRTGRPVRGIRGVAVVGATGLDTDALDEVLFVLGPDRGRRHLPEGYAAVMLLDDGRLVDLAPGS